MTPDWGILEAVLRYSFDDGLYGLYGGAPIRLNAGMAGTSLAHSRKGLMTPSGTQSATTFEDLLVSIGKTGSRDDFVRVFEYFAPRVKSFLIKGGLAPDTADEIAQETMLTVWNRAATFDPARAAASTWIYTIARNKRIDHLRRAARPEPGPDDPDSLPSSAYPAPDEALDRETESRRLESALRSLPEEQAQMVRKSFYEEKPHAVIAAETGLPLGTVKSRIRLALDRLRRTMDPREGGGERGNAP